MNSEEIEVPAEAAGERVDRFACAQVPGLGRAAARRLIEAGLVRVNGRRVAAGARLQPGDRVGLAAAREPDVVPEPNLPLHVVFEDACVLVVDKAAGLPTHPLRPGERGTLAGALLAGHPELAGVGYSRREPGIVHRLDGDTSGLVLVARDAPSFEALRAQLDAGAIDKRYLALCAGALEVPAVHEAWLSARGPKVTVRESAFGDAQKIRTELLAAERYGDFTLVTVRVSRARRHQIRAHLAALGHPIAGDALYGGPELPGFTRHFLHASELAFDHPRTGARVEVRAELPDDAQAVLERLRAGRALRN